MSKCNRTSQSKPNKRSTTGASPPRNGEARTAVAASSGLKGKQKIKQTDDICLPKNGKPSDSRTEVINKAKSTAKSARIGLSIATSSPEKIAALRAILQDLPGVSARIQETRLARALRLWSPLTCCEMFADLDLVDWRARIQGLRKQGFEIEKDWVLVETQRGALHRVGAFSLQRGIKAMQLKPRQVDLFDGAAA